MASPVSISNQSSWRADIMSMRNKYIHMMHNSTSLSLNELELRNQELPHTSTELVKEEETIQLQTGQTLQQLVPCTPATLLPCLDVAATMCL